MTKESDNETAKINFIQRMNHSDMYFTKEEIPRNESDEKAHVLCGDVESAKKYCPTRWRALENWFTEARMVSELYFQCSFICWPTADRLEREELVKYELTPQLFKGWLALSTR